MKICLWGCAPETDNLGVSALFVSAASAIYRRHPSADLTVFDFGRGVRKHSLVVDQRTHTHRRIGAAASRRWWRPESLSHLNIALRTGGWASAGARALKQADLVLDLSAGDSFTDLYGPRRFNTVCGPKKLARIAQRPLILLPQTIGPFQTPASAHRAANLLAGAAQAWARDAESLDRMRQLLGDRFNPARHRQGVDLAFALPSSRPTLALPKVIAQWLKNRSSPPVGLNISGLIYNHPKDAAKRFGLKADYRAIVHGLLEALLKDPDIRVVLTPHVLSAPSLAESDLQACQDALQAIIACCPKARDQVAVLPCIHDPSAIKWVIGQFSWFCGTRMHATIAALSSGVPAAALAYSLKTRGVFDTVGLGHATVDPREHNTQTCIDQLLNLYRNRAQHADILNQTLPDVQRRADTQFDDILALPAISPVTNLLTHSPSPA
ncbi:MAG: polysaccharide pyruvyl transferase family protein [Algisphaera sp.]